MRTYAIIALLAAAACLGAADKPATFTGRITDTMCGASHNMVKGQADEECVRACVRNTSSQYAFFDGKSVLRLSDQKTPARFAGQKVKVTGVYNEKTRTIKVTAIEPAG